MIFTQFGISNEDKGKYVYHYTSMNTALKYIFPSKELRCGSVKNFNDPQEKYVRRLSARIMHDVDKDPYFDYNWDNITNDVSEIIVNLMKIISFAQDGEKTSVDTNSWCGALKPRMWAQYADNNKGVCLILNKEKLIMNMKNNFAPFLLFGDVNYSCSIADVRSIVDNMYVESEKICKYNICKTKYAMDMIINRGKILFFNKNMDWKDENEFRFIIVSQENKDKYFNIDGILEGVIVGTDALMSEIEMIKFWNKNFNKNFDIKKLHSNIFMYDLYDC